jgi:hypothetical protein
MHFFILKCILLEHVECPLETLGVKNILVLVPDVTGRVLVESERVWPNDSVHIHRSY